MTIRLKLFLTYVGVAILPLAIIGWVLYGAVQKALVDQIHARLMALAVEKKDRLISNVISGTLTDERFQRIVKDYEVLGETGETIVVGKDEGGNPVLLTPRRFDATVVVPSRLDAARMPGATGLALLKEETFRADIDDYRGQRVFAASTYYPEKDWGIVVKIDRAEVLAPIGTLLIDPLLISIIFIILTVAFVAIVMTQSVVAPIRDLTEVTHAISMGNLRTTIDPELLAAQDETGDLARAFDRTVISLKLAMADVNEKDKIVREANRQKNGVKPPS